MTSIGQSTSENVTRDTVIHYNSSIHEYTFYLEGVSQQFYWDTIQGIPSNLRFKVINNVGVPVQLKRVGGGDGAIIFSVQLGKNTFRIHPPDYAILMPDSFLLIKPILNSRHNNFRKRLAISYALYDTLKTMSIGTWGHSPILKNTTTNNKILKEKSTKGKSSYTIGNQKYITYKCADQSSDIDSNLFELRDPEYPGGYEALRKYMDDNYNQRLVDEIGIEARIIVSFVIDVDGTLKKFEVLKSANRILDRELYRVLKSTPRWKSSVCNPDRSREETFEGDSRGKAGLPLYCYCSKKVFLPFKVKPSIKQ